MANFQSTTRDAQLGSDDIRLGVMIPASDAVVERDFARYLPRGMSFHVARLMQNIDAAAAGTSNLDGMIGYVPEAARALIPVEPDLVLFCCTSASFYRGPTWNRELDDQVSRLTGRPAVTTSTALLRALTALKARKFYLVTPYPDRVNQNECNFFQANGAEVVGVHTFNCAYSREIADVTPPRILSELIAKKNELASADCIIISCTGLRSLEIAEDAERAMGIPVVTSNMASLWIAFDQFRRDHSHLPQNILFSTRCAENRASTVNERALG